MATEEEINKFVEENKELIERMMKIRSDFSSTRQAGKDLAISAVENTAAAAAAARSKSEEFFKDTVSTITDPVVQRHFMNASLEFLEGLSTLVAIAPIPDFVKDAASSIEKNARNTACKANKDCPNKAEKIEIEAPKEDSAE